MNYECKVATEEMIIKKWDEEILKHNNSLDWIEYKKASLECLKTRIIYMGLLDGKIITEATAVISSDDLHMQNKDGLIDVRMAYLMAFRTDKNYRGNGYFSTLYKFMEDDLQSRGFDFLTLGVEPCEVKNMMIYFNWGYTSFVKNAYEEEPNGNKVMVNFYKKILTNNKDI